MAREFNSIIPLSRRSGWLFAVPPARSPFWLSGLSPIPRSFNNSGRDLSTGAYQARAKEDEREEKRIRVCGFRLRGQVDPPGIGTYIHTYIRVHRTIDLPHFSGPSLRVRQFRMSFFPFFFFFFFIYFASHSTKSAAFWTAPVCYRENSYASALAGFFDGYSLRSIHEK